MSVIFSTIFVVVIIFVSFRFVSFCFVFILSFIFPYGNRILYHSSVTVAKDMWGQLVIMTVKLIFGDENDNKYKLD